MKRSKLSAVSTILLIAVIVVVVPLTTHSTKASSHASISAQSTTVDNSNNAPIAQECGAVGCSAIEAALMAGALAALILGMGPLGAIAASMLLAA